MRCTIQCLGRKEGTTGEPDGGGGIWGELWKGMKVTGNQKGFFSKEQAIEISWLPQTETWLIGQIKATKGDLRSAAPNGAEHTGFCRASFTSTGSQGAPQAPRL